MNSVNNPNQFQIWIDERSIDRWIDRQIDRQVDRQIDQSDGFDPL